MNERNKAEFFFKKENDIKYKGKTKWQMYKKERIKYKKESNKYQK